MRKATILLTMLLLTLAVFIPELPEVQAQVMTVASWLPGQVNSGLAMFALNGPYPCTGSVNCISGTSFFVPTERPFNLTKTTHSLRKTGSPICQMSGYIFNTQAQQYNTLPDSLTPIATSDNVVECASLTATSALFNFTFSGSVQLNKGTYYIAAAGVSARTSTNVTNYSIVDFYCGNNPTCDDSPIYENSCCSSGAWISQGTDNQVFAVYGVAGPGGDVGSGYCTYCRESPPASPTKQVNELPSARILFTSGVVIALVGGTALLLKRRLF